MEERISRSTVIVAPPQGGVISLVSDEGELLVDFPIAPGQHSAGKFLRHVQPGTALHLGSGVVALPPVHRLFRDHFGEQAFESAANPHFKVTTAQRMALQLDRQLRQVNVAQRALDARLRAAERAGMAPSEPVEPVEPVEALEAVEPVNPGKPVASAGKS